MIDTQPCAATIRYNIGMIKKGLRSSGVRASLVSILVLGLVIAPTASAASASAPAKFRLNSISCVSKSLCRAAGGNKSDHVERWDGHKWAPGFRFDDAMNLNSISCTSKDFCAAVESVKTASGAVDYRPVTRNADDTWDASAALQDAQTRIPEVSCTSASFCLLVNSNRGYQRWNGTSWSAPETFQKTRHETLVSCASPTMCKAVIDVDGYKNAFNWNGSSWSAQYSVPVAEHIDALACPTTTFCMLALGPDYVTLSGSRVSAGKSLPREIDFDGLSCTSASFCIGVNGGDKGSIRWDGKRWSGPHTLKGQSYLSVSCSSTSFCAAGGFEGNYLNRVNGTWTAPHPVT